MFCSNPDCRTDEIPVKWIGPDEWLIGTYHVASDAPICPECGWDLEVHPPSMIESDSIVLFLHMLG